MTQELLYTSAPRGLKPGSRGYCTVASTQSMSAPLARVLESLSGYRHVEPPGDPANPVAYSHVALVAGGRRYQVVSRVCDSGHDYTGRSNKLAHHVVLEAGERPAGGPGWLISRPGFLQDSWEGEPRLLPSSRPAPGGDSLPSRCTAWQDMTGDAGWAGVLAEAFLEDANRQVFIVFEPGMELLPLLEEAIALLPPDRRWEVTFNTFATSIPAGVECRWRCVLAGSPEANQSRRHVRALRIDLTEPLPVATGGSLVEVARTGKRPVAPVPRSPAAMPPPHPATATKNPLADPAGTYGLGRTPARPTRPVRLAGQRPPRQPGARSLRINPLVIATVVLLAVGGGLAARYWKPGSTAPVVEVASAGQQASTPADTAAPGSDNTHSKTIAPPEARKVALGGPPAPPEPMSEKGSSAELPEGSDSPSAEDPSTKEASNKTEEAGSSGPGNTNPGETAGTNEGAGNEADSTANADNLSTDADKKPAPGSTPENPTDEQVVYIDIPDNKKESEQPLVYLALDPGEAGFEGWKAELLVPDGTELTFEQQIRPQSLQLTISAPTATGPLSVGKLTINASNSRRSCCEVRFVWQEKSQVTQLVRNCAIRLTIPDHEPRSLVLHQPTQVSPVSFKQFTVTLSLADTFSPLSKEAVLQSCVLSLDGERSEIRFMRNEASAGADALIEASSILPEGVLAMHIGLAMASDERHVRFNPHATYSTAGLVQIGDDKEDTLPARRVHDKFDGVRREQKRDWSNRQNQLRGQIGDAPRDARTSGAADWEPQAALQKLREKKGAKNNSVLLDMLIAEVGSAADKMDRTTAVLDFLDSLATARVTHATIAVPLYTVDDAVARRNDKKKRKVAFYADLIRIRPAEGSTGQAGEESNDKASADKEPAAAEQQPATSRQSRQRNSGQSVRRTGHGRRTALRG